MASLGSFCLPLPIGVADAATQWATFLGKTFESGGNTYRLVKAAGAITAAANKVLVTTVTSHAPVWTVNTTTSANSALVAGVVPAGQTGSDGTTGLLSGDYFLIQCGGIATPLCHTTAVAISTGLATSTTAGSADAVSGTFAATTPGAVFAYLLEATSGVDAVAAARLTGLV
jgi:hypothetical protein